MTEPRNLAIEVQSILLRNLRAAPDFWNDGSPEIVGIAEAASEIAAKILNIRTEALDDGARIVREQIISSHLKMAQKHQDAAADARHGSRYAPDEEDRKIWKEFEKKSLLLSDYHSSSARALQGICDATDATSAISTQSTSTNA